MATVRGRYRNGPIELGSKSHMASDIWDAVVHLIQEVSWRSIRST